MKIIVETIDNGYLVSEESAELEKEETSFPPPSRVAVVEDSLSEIGDQRAMQRLLYTVMEQLGKHYSKHGVRVHIELRDADGNVVE